MKKKRGGDIVKVGDLFETYKKRLRAPQGTVVKTFVEIVADMLKVDIAPKNCTYTVATKTLSVQVSGPLKSEILLRKKEVLAHLKGRLGDKSAPKNII